MPVKPHMTSSKIVRCPDGHYRRAIFSLGPYIADYPEQVLVAGIVNSWCPAYVNPLHLASIIPSHEHSCDASSTDLDNLNAEPRTSEKTEILLQTKSVDELWYEHGLVHDFRVRIMYIKVEPD